MTTGYLQVDSARPRADADRGNVSCSVRLCGGLLCPIGFVVNGLGNSGFVLTSSLNALLPAASVAGLGAAAFTGEITLLQANISAAVRGRVIALTIVLATVMGIVALAVGGWLADPTEVRSVMLIASLVHMTIGGWAYAVPRPRVFCITAEAAYGDQGERNWQLIGRKVRGSTSRP